ncbi:MAG TPA: hypothetical protein DCX08_10440 [Porticoccaceae bacterium]|jgi:AcrR family transcriptional regulator|nr:hypothetical protein [Porticoccaceae bacterium]
MSEGPSSNNFNKDNNKKIRSQITTKALTSSHKKTVSSPRARKSQPRSHEIRKVLIDCATPLFSLYGFNAISVRDIEIVANMKRGVLIYHFKDKANFWRAVADNLFNVIDTQRRIRMSVLKDVSKLEGVAMLIRFNVRLASEHPEFARFLTQETKNPSWRLEYLVENHLKSASKSLQKYVTSALNITNQEFAHWYYIMFTASAGIFASGPECALLFGIDSHQPDIVETHSKMLVALLMAPYKY